MDNAYSRPLMFRRCSEAWRGCGACPTHLNRLRKGVQPGGVPKVVGVFITQSRYASLGKVGEDRQVGEVSHVTRTYEANLTGATLATVCLVHLALL